MSQRFKLEVVKVECPNEQLREVGKDEMRLIGFAISRKGHFFKTGFRSLGSYGTGDVQSDGAFPMVLVETDLEDDGLEVLFYVWLVEEDGGGGGKAAAKLGLEFRDRLRVQIDQLGTLGFPRDCIPFTTIYKVALPFHLILEEAGTEGRNDHVYDPFEVILDKPSGSRGLFGVSKSFVFQRSKHLGQLKPAPARCGVEKAPYWPFDSARTCVDLNGSGGRRISVPPRRPSPDDGRTLPRRSDLDPRQRSWSDPWKEPP